LIVVVVAGVVAAALLLGLAFLGLAAAAAAAVLMHLLSGGGVGATPETRHGIGQPLRGNLRRRIDGSSKVAAGKEPPAAVIAVAKADALLLRAATSFGANA
jgi:hypothetical protein